MLQGTLPAGGSHFLRPGDMGHHPGTGNLHNVHDWVALLYPKPHEDRGKSRRKLGKLSPTECSALARFRFPKDAGLIPFFAGVGIHHRGNVVVLGNIPAEIPPFPFI